MTVIAVTLGLYVKSLRDRRAAIVAIEQLGGAMGIKYSGPAWLRALVGDEKYFWDPAGVHFNTDHRIADDELPQVVNYLKGFNRLWELTLAGSQVTDAGLAQLRPLSNKLRQLNLSDTAVSDAGLVQLECLTSLKDLDLRNTPVTDAGVAELQKVLPNCRIHR
jgi:hypothetical protein